MQDVGPGDCVLQVGARPQHALPPNSTGAAGRQEAGCHDTGGFLLAGDFVTMRRIPGRGQAVVLHGADRNSALYMGRRGGRDIARSWRPEPGNQQRLREAWPLLQSRSALTAVVEGCSRPDHRGPGIRRAVQHGGGFGLGAKPAEPPRALMCPEKAANPCNVRKPGDGTKGQRQPSDRIT